MFVGIVKNTRKYIFFKKIAFLFILLCVITIQNLAFSKTIMFSARGIEEGTKSKLFVIYNSDVFIRNIKKDKQTFYKFNYISPKDGCYKLENSIDLCVKNGYVESITGNYYTISEEDKLAKPKYNDEFFNERNLSCNIMKFDVINHILSI